jgi:DNA-binding PucR family transcriptional regulator
VPVLLVPDPDGPGRPALLRAALRRSRSVLGPTVPWAEAARSVTRAVSGWRLHAEGAFGDAPLVRADDHLLALLLAADPFLIRDLVRLRLHALDAQPRGVRLRAEATLRAWLDAHGDVARAAESLGVHPQTVRYRLAALRELLGDALDDPVARLETALALRAVQLER